MKRNPRFLYICLSLLFICGTVQAKNTLSFTPQLGLMYGEVNEYVIRQNDGSLLSKLIWPFHPAGFFGFSVQLFLNDVSVTGEIITGFPTQTGYITDFDYMNTGSTRPTHYSKHTAQLETFFQTHVSAGYRFNFAEKYSLTPAISFRWEKAQWAAHDGYLQYPQGNAPYPDWTGNEPKEPIYGYGMNFMRYIWYPALRLDFGMQISRKISLSAGFTIAPYLFSQSIDNHFLRSLEFYDITEGGYFLGGELGLMVKAGKHDIGIKACFEYTGLLTGLSIIRDIGANEPTYTRNNAKAGTDGYTFSISVAYRFSVF